MLRRDYRLHYWLANGDYRYADMTFPSDESAKRLGLSGINACELSSWRLVELDGSDFGRLVVSHNVGEYSI